MKSNNFFFVPRENKKENQWRLPVSYLCPSPGLGPEFLTSASSFTSLIMPCPPPRELGPECFTAPMTESPLKTPLTGVMCRGRASVKEGNAMEFRRRGRKRREETRKRAGLAMRDVVEKEGRRVISVGTLCGA